MERSNPIDIKFSENESSPALNSLERIRQRLVDTGARNRLINCSLDRAQVVRLVDELPDQVYARLSDGKPFSMAPVPAPTHQELLDGGYVAFDEHTGEQIKDSYPKPDVWARRLGIETGYDLPDGVADSEANPGHQDDKLQTLLFPDRMNAQLGKIRQLAQTAMEESGTNILYLALGFLEWYESTSSVKPRLSPLFVVPVDLTRGKQVSVDGLRTYQVNLRDDGLLSNVSLSQRLVQDFGLELPVVTDTSEPESYFEAVRAVIEHMDPRWRVRRYAAICLLDFTKQLMYEDLDPARWPADKILEDHPLLQQFLSAGDNAGQEGSSATLSEHLIDDMEQVHSQFPLIYEADSSQHSALIDVVNGNNLVIEGPPGTGKSQTITNLIAACINQGLSVLFVAEKLAALEVVKRRLDLAELGDFCLEVHSHKSSKLSILNSLMDSNRRRENAKAPAELDQQIRRYEGHKNTLHSYAEKLNQPWLTTELTPHQILQRATNLGERSPLASDANVVLVQDPGQISATLIDDTLDAAERLQVVFEAVANQTPDATINTHPWFGVRNGNLSGPQRQTFISSLEQWAEQQRQIMDRWSDLQESLCIEPIDTPSQDTLTELMGTLEDLPRDIPANLLQRIEELRDSKLELDSIGQQRQDFRKRFTEFASDINSEDLLNAERATATTGALQVLRDDLGLTGSAPLEKVIQHADQLGVLQSRLEALHTDTQALQGVLPSTFDDVFELSRNGCRSLAELLNLAGSLPGKIWRHRNEQYTDPEFSQALDAVEPVILSLRQQQEHLANTFNTSDLPDSQTLDDISRILENGGLFSFLNSEYREAKSALKDLSRTGVKPAIAIAALPKLVSYQESLEGLAEKHRRNPILGDAFQGLDTDLSLHQTMARWYQTVEEQFNQNSLQQSPKASALFSIDQQAARLLVRAAASDLGERALSVDSSLVKLQRLYPQFFSNYSDDSPALDSLVGLPGLIDQIKRCLAELGHSLLDPSQSLSTLLDLANRWSNCAMDHQQWTENEHYSRFVPSLFSISAHPDADDSRAESTLSSARYLGDLASKSGLFFAAMQREPTLEQLSRLREAQPAFMGELEAASTSQERFDTLGDVDRSQWLSDCSTMAQSHTRNQRALDQANWLDTWLSYQRVKQRAGLETLTGLTDLLENGTLPSDQTSLAVEADLYQQLACHVMNVDSELAAFDGNEIQAIRQQFQRFDKELLGLQRQQIAANCSKTVVPEGNSRGAVGTHTEFALIQREASKKKRHIAIRSLLNRAPAAIKALKPCFMMSPMSVAQYLEPGQYEFDVIVMDEASQIRPEEALGAIARAKQLVVVGDPKQLPPTSFFSRMASDDEQDDNEDVGLQQAESILDAVIPIFQTRRLRWHYRSRHESLIAFSNQKFYDSDLVLFPSPFNNSDEYGINFTRLSDATFKEGVNLIEAERIVDLLAVQVQQRPHESVGIVAMNIRQRDQIEAQWELRLASDNLLQRALERNQETDEPLFMKNLENVQGDERDVIIISMTYGPEMAGGVTYQRFGPINSDTGWRRLNVLLTRSKKRMEIVSSMGSADVRADNTSKLGVQSLRALLEYCETGHLNTTVHTGRQPDSAFEVAVIRKLAAVGYDCEPQVGVAGFFIDLAVRNPDNPGEFLMGIECDGATYHSAKSARDRDRLRQEVLENLGWEIRRIWSTDWFRNADAQLQPIVAELERMRAERSR